MPKREDEPRRGEHYPYCTCVACQEARLKRLKREAHPDYISKCPLCDEESLWWNGRHKIYECLNLECRVTGRSIRDIHRYKSSPSYEKSSAVPEVSPEPTEISTEYRSPPEPTKISTEHRSFPGYLIFLLVIFTLGILGTGFWMFSNTHVDIEDTTPSPVETLTQSVPSPPPQPIPEPEPEPKPIPTHYTNPDGFEIYEHTQIPYARAFGTQIHLINNEDAIYPTWEQLKTRLATDRTDQQLYSLGVRVCGDFAEQVHNYAEANGIRAAFVVIEQEGEPTHALNVFQTTDKGPVFIDCTGKGLTPIAPIPFSFGGTKIFGGAESWDKVAYIKLGEPLGLISVDVVHHYGFRYSSYEKWKQDKALFDLKGREYEEQLGGRLFVPSPEYRYLMRQLKELEELANTLGTFWDPGPVVYKMSIYW